MRKLEGVVKEIVDELDYLKKREERFQTTNSALLCSNCKFSVNVWFWNQYPRMDACSSLRGSPLPLSSGWGFGRFSTYVHFSNENTSLIEFRVLY